MTASQNWKSSKNKENFLSHTQALKLDLRVKRNLWDNHASSTTFSLADFADKKTINFEINRLCSKRELARKFVFIWCWII